MIPLVYIYFHAANKYNYNIINSINKATFIFKSNLTGATIYIVILLRIHIKHHSKPFITQASTYSYRPIVAESECSQFL